MFVPPKMLPVYVFLVGRRQCCGARRRAAHLDSCPREPWVGAGRPTRHAVSASAGGRRALTVAR
jgi:hypothetical protein